MSWGDFWNGGSLGSQMQEGPEMGLLERILINQNPQDFLRRLMWGQQGQRMPRPQYEPSARDQWKEMLERQMWNQINQRPGQRMGIQGAMPTYMNMRNRQGPTNMIGGVRGNGYIN